MTIIAHFKHAILTVYLHTLGERPTQGLQEGDLTDQKLQCRYNMMKVYGLFEESW